MRNNWNGATISHYKYISLDLRTLIIGATSIEAIRLQQASMLVSSSTYNTPIYLSIKQIAALVE